LTVRWITGLVGLVGIAAAMTYPRRKRIYRRRAGPLRYWMLAHIYAGVVAGLLLLLHGGRDAGGLLTTTLMISFDLVIGTGLFGLAGYLIVPRLLTKIEGEPLLVEDLETRRAELRASLAQSRAGEGVVSRTIDGQVIPRVLTFGNLLRQYFSPAPLTEVWAGWRTRFEPILRDLATQRDRERVIESIEDSASLSRVQALIHLHRLLKSWLAPHIVSTSLMLILMLVHIIQVVFFLVR
jgi:hypothetical protein